MALAQLQEIFAKRRSVYALNDTLPISKQALVDLVEHAVLHTPSSFNSQSTRLVVLFGEDHKKVWQIAEQQLRQVMGDRDFSATQAKLDAFAAAAGTILFFEDESVVKGLQEQFPPYAERFPIWAEHSNAMHQYAIWSALRSVDVGANLQHYNPLIDDDVRAAFDLPADWKLIAQMPFGGIVQEAGEKAFGATDSRLKVFGL